ncbi:MULTISPECIES: c-type cytochrome biogenesis protein CcmI [Methylotenera]|uniref:c-type cytochrome biogenesis protein CcmI n=1 Tax=Methylotenera TaxID=359407 RepID=UPI0003A2B02A|nr:MULTISPECIES: c-type cytochrome biogenesis protein CcmI [Methylotenera]
MLIFWGAAALLMIASLAILLPPLLKPAREIATDAQSEKLALYRQQFAELEQDRASGVLAAQQYELANSELQHRLLDEAGGDVAKTLTFTADKCLAVLLLIALPVFSVLIYQKIGHPTAINELLAQQTKSVDRDAAQIEPILKSLREKLDKDPNDAAGWALLGRAYGKLHRYDEAIFAFDKAEKLAPDDAELLTDYAVVLAMANDRKVDGKPETLVFRALKIDPHLPNALMLGASIAFKHQDYKTAIELWERLQPDLPVGSEIALSVEKSLAEAKALVTN